MNKYLVSQIMSDLGKKSWIARTKKYGKEGARKILSRAAKKRGKALKNKGKLRFAQ